MPDIINHPPHYTGGKVECIDALEAATENLTGIEAICTANAIKYLWRWRHKNGVEDLKKARWYLDRLITRLSEDVATPQRKNPCSGCTSEAYAPTPGCQGCSLFGDAVAYQRSKEEST